MEICKKLKYMYSAAKKAGYIYDILKRPNYENERIEGEILRNVHSLEKGLSIENIRLGFGIAKIKEASLYIDKYIKNGGNYNSEPIKMFVCALHSYLKFHEGKLYNDDIKYISNIYNNLISKVPSQDFSLGGYKIITKNILSENEIKTIDKLINNRHSIREFNHTPVEERLLKEAILLAMKCPTACNRQGYRCYIVEKDKFYLLDKWMDGIGGFSNDVDKFIIITGKISMYRKEEELQWIVTAIVFASYLTITLEAYGIGCCFVQRPIVPNKEWKNVAKKLHISDDEQVACMLAIGNLKEQYKVPISNRLSYDEMVTIIQ